MSAGEAEGERPRILVADDSKVMRASARKMLGEEFDVVLAEDGEQAWETLREDRQILAVFSDIKMPGLDGYQLLERIRGAREVVLQEMPVIIVTGDDEEAARDQALEKGASDFITKPFERSQLVARARTHASADQARRHARALEADRLTDPVSGLGNRRYFEQRLKQARARALRHRESMALIRLDLIDFDQLARRLGRQGSTELVAAAAENLAETVRTDDVVSRISGGRFAIICPVCDAAGAERLTRRLVETVASAGGRVREGLELQVAAGMHVPALDESSSLDEIFRAVQAAVKRAVELGAGEMVFAGESVRPKASATAPDLDLDQALALAAAGGDERLDTHADALLEKVATLLRALPAERVRKHLGRLVAGRD